MHRRRWPLRRPGALALDTTLLPLAPGVPAAPRPFRPLAPDLAGDALGAAADLLFGVVVALVTLGAAGIWLYRRWGARDDGLVVRRDGIHWTEERMPQFLRWHDLARIAVTPDGGGILLERPDGTRL